MKRLVCIVLCVVLCLSGCGNIALTDSEMGMVSEYAAYVVLKHNRLYNSRLQDEVYEVETRPGIPVVMETTPQGEVTENPDGGQSSSSGVEDIAALSEGLGLDGFEVEYKDYELMDTYADEYFNFSATTGKTLLVLRFDITNPEETEQEADVLQNQFKFRCTVNHEKRVGSQLTMLVNDLYSFKEVLAPQETKEAVLIFQLPEKYENAVESLELTVKNDEESHKYTLE